MFAKFHCDGPRWFLFLPDRSKKVSLWKLEHSRSSQHWNDGVCVNIIYILSALVPVDSLNSVVKCLVLSLCSRSPWGHSLRSGSKNYEKQKETAVQKFFLSIIYYDFMLLFLHFHNISASESWMSRDCSPCLPPTLLRASFLTYYPQKLENRLICPFIISCIIDPYLGEVVIQCYRSFVVVFELF